MGADTSMNKLDKSLQKICAVLEKVTKERAECLKTFITCKPLVDWLKESMPCMYELIQIKLNYLLNDIIKLIYQHIELHPYCYSMLVLGTGD